MKRFFALILIPLFCIQNLMAVDNTFIDYQNYNHGYCSSCNYCPCRCDGEQRACSAPPCAEPPTPCNAPAPCPAQPCTPCDPCAPVCGTECGVSVCAIVVAIGAVAAAAAIIIGASNGTSSSH